MINSSQKYIEKVNKKYDDLTKFEMIKQQRNGSNSKQLSKIQYKNHDKAIVWIKDQTTLVQNIKLNNKTIKKQSIEFKQSLMPKGILSKLLSMPKYIKLTESNIINGGFGYGSVLFKRPIIQGTYFVQIKILPDATRLNESTKNASAVRIGIAPSDYKIIHPLGLRESICYKSCDGKIMTNGSKIHQSLGYKVGDIIGVMLKMAPPHKFPHPAQIIEDSYVRFYKNGKFVYEYKQLKQIFYCFCVSCFNYSRVQVLQNLRPQYLTKNLARHYYSVLNEEILYQNLKEKQMFKIGGI